MCSWSCELLLLWRRKWWPMRSESCISNSLISLVCSKQSLSAFLENLLIWVIIRSVSMQKMNFYLIEYLLVSCILPTSVKMLAFGKCVKYVVKSERAKFWRNCLLYIWFHFAFAFFTPSTDHLHNHSSNCRIPLNWKRLAATVAWKLPLKSLLLTGRL